MQRYDVIVLGAGAAGLMCAIEAGRRGRRVLVVDHAERVGSKVLISGGGRCNFTNLHCQPENFISGNPHFARSALARFTPADMIAMVERHGIAYHEKTLGQLFCDGSAREVVTMLEQECAQAGVRIMLKTEVTGLMKEGTGFVMQSPAGPLTAGSVVVATGGLSIPKMGATGFGYELARQFGLKIVDPRPGLVPLTFAAEDREAWSDLSGVSAEAVVALRERGERRSRMFREKMLITHRGLSGPAILQASSYWRAGEAIALDLAPDKDVFAHMAHGDATRDAAAALTRLRPVLTARWAERWLARQLEGTGVGRLLSNATLARLETQIHDWQIVPAGTEGFAKAEVTVGGVDTGELDARTMGSRRVAGLYFIGEVVDVTGWLGGYNFQWAWASGFAAGQVC